VLQSTALIVKQNTTFGMSRQRRANSICAGVARGLLGGRSARYRVLPMTGIDAGGYLCGKKQARQQRVLRVVHLDTGTTR
jgi:hypothetical protein